MAVKDSSLAGDPDGSVFTTQNDGEGIYIEVTCGTLNGKLFLDKYSLETRHGPGKCVCTVESLFRLAILRVSGVRVLP